MAHAARPWIQRHLTQTRERPGHHTVSGPFAFPLWISDAGEEPEPASGSSA